MTIIKQHKSIRFSIYAILILVCFILVLPYSGLLKHILWRMDPAPLFPNGHNLAQELGFERDAKLLVINSDDTAANPTFTHGIIKVMEKGLVRSNSVIVNDRNDAELERNARLSKQHPDWGFGVHLMLTNEYQEAYPWALVLSKDVVPSLYNDKGLAWASVAEVEQHANPAEVELEFKAQIQKALDAGINVSHIDSHMGTYYRQSGFAGAKADALLQAAINAAHAFNIPMTFNTFDQQAKAAMAHADALGIIRPDTFFGFYQLEEMNSHLSYKGNTIMKWLTAWVVKMAFDFNLPYENQATVKQDVAIRMGIYKTALRNITQPGLNHFFMHAAHEHSDGHKIPFSVNHKNKLSDVIRLSDTQVWRSDEMQQFLIEQDFKLVNYNQIKSIQRKWINKR